MLVGLDRHVCEVDGSRVKLTVAKLRLSQGTLGLLHCQIVFRKVEQSMSVIQKTMPVSLLAGLALIGLSSCGSSGDAPPAAAAPPPPAMAKVAVLFTDAPTDEFSAIRLDVVEARLIGGGADQVLFQGQEPIDLLDLTNYSEPVVFGEAEPGTYTKLRLLIDNLELEPKDGSPSIFPSLPANGKIDLLDPNGFDVRAGRSLMIEIDMDANKAIKITKAGNSNRYQFRPVVKVNIIDTGLPDKLARLEGTVSQIFADPAGSFELCDLDSPDSCVDVTTDSNTSAFDAEGLATDIANLMVDDMVVVIGQYAAGDDIVLNAVVIEIGGNAEQVKANVVTNPVANEFLVITEDGMSLTVETQPETKYFDANGAIGAGAIVLGVDVEIEGVKPPKADPMDPDVMRAALVFLEADADEQISGTISDPLDSATRSFGLMLTGGGDTCVRVDADADILLVDTAASEVTMGDFDDLSVSQAVELFGVTAVDSCFDANEVIVEVP